MPTYEYKREDGTTFEVRQGINDEPLSECPDTGQKVSRIITGGGGVVYKGSGWYVTDYKNNGRPKSEAKNGNGSESRTGKAETASASSAADSGSGSS